MIPRIQRIQLAEQSVQSEFNRTVLPGALSLWGLHSLVRGCQVLERYTKRTPAQESHPIVIAGLPRTGTTFLHRFLHDGQVGKGQELWEQLLPSVTLQKLLRPFQNKLERISPGRHHQKEIHKTGLNMVETDEACLFLHQWDGFFLYAFFLAFAEEDHLPLFENHLLHVRERDFRWLKRCWRYSAGNTKLPPIAKLFGLGASLPDFFRHFPKAKVIYTARNPMEFIPSTLSLLKAVLSKRYNWNDYPNRKKERYYRRVAFSLIELMHRFDQNWRDGTIPKEKVLIVPYSTLKHQFEESMHELLSFVQHDPSEKLKRTILEVSASQKDRKSQHRYQLSDFFLSETELREECAFFQHYWSPQ